MYKHYARLNEDKKVIKFFSDAFEEPLSADILISETSDRQCVKTTITMDGIYLYEYKDKKIVERDLTAENTEKLRQRVISKIKSKQGSDIENATFTHNGKIFKCGVTSQISYMGLKTNIDIGLATYPAKCWTRPGEDYFIQDENELKTMIGKLFSVVYPIREKANADEQIALNASLEILENM